MGSDASAEDRMIPRQRMTSRRNASRRCASYSENSEFPSTAKPWSRSAR